MSEQPQIYTALAAVMGEVTAVAKKDRNEFHRFMFRGIDAVVNAVGPALRKHNVVVVPNVVNVNYADVHTSKGKPATACRVLATYTFFAADGSSVAATVAGEAWDDGDKATPKAMSVAFRTALLQALTLPTDEPDPDSETFERAPANHGGQQANRGGQQAPPRSDSPLQQAWQQVSAAFTAVKINDPAERQAFITSVLGRDVAGPGDLTLDDMKFVLQRLQPTDGDQPGA